MSSVDPTKRHVFVTGAGFTHALVPKAPLLVDDFDNEGLVTKVNGLPNASHLLESERNLRHYGRINIERLMTRLHERMPYDHSHGVIDEYAFLLAELKRAFRQRLSDAMNGVTLQGDVVKFAQHCAALEATCITFNYDDFLDAALSTTGSWNPDWGYGFFCRSSATAVSGLSDQRHRSSLQLLKLHGSVNWWPKFGHAEPFALDAIVHHHGWEGIARHLYRREIMDRHLDAEPVIVPPVLSKSDLVAQPVFRLVWTLAFEHLSSADEVTFIGYSFPTTDMAARTLFSEALRDLDPTDVHVVNHQGESGRSDLMGRYWSVLGEIPDDRFIFDDAANWIQRLPPSASH